MKLLSGSELAGYIKERQSKQVRRLRQALNISPKLAIIVTIDNPVTDTYLRMKERYGADILVDVEVHRVKQSEVVELISKLNEDDTVHGIILQLPLQDSSQTEAIVNMINPNKDVDGLNEATKFDPATPLAILWLISGYNVELLGKEVLLVGQGKLVGAPLRRMLNNSGIETQVANRTTKDLKAATITADVIITATGVIGLIKSDMIKENAIVIDAGVASEESKTAGDVDREVYEQRDDLTITPKRGGVGPLTVCALFDNVILACEKLSEKT